MDNETWAADERMGQVEIPFPDVVIGLSTAQLCLITVSHIVLVMVLVGLGTLIQVGSDDTGRPEGVPAAQALITENARLTGERNEAQRLSDNAQAMLRSETADREALQAKAEFLERALTYRMAATPAARARLVDHVCALWSQPAKFRTQTEQAPVAITAAELRRGLPADMSTYLVHEGVPAMFLQQAQGARPGQVPPQTYATPLLSNFLTTPSVADEAVDRILRQTQSLRAIKAIRFYDGTVQQVPQEIALAVQTRADCVPF
jgi:hypothetical protein